ncbi:hypothetical protein [Allokutzneria albata]|uniref:Uncharacterized protein n=1 Tax=Allokutzneria albata TaxID=211114 RepID=A0A1H0CP33_ALLAB|nr:hypothetical protein [Allokutzneria albata]SDN59677.1 hypothetical protein SAMN04489726_7338 [Allokutzneria albata]
MTSTEPSTIAELIKDCAELPDSLRSSSAGVPQQRAAAPWRVSEANTAQVRDMDDYGC